jgi:hypothetical protein
MPFEEVRDRLVPVPTTDVAVWLNAVRQTLEKSGSLNKTAAGWTESVRRLNGLVCSFRSALVRHYDVACPLRIGAPICVRSKKRDRDWCSAV